MLSSQDLPVIHGNMIRAACAAAFDAVNATCNWCFERHRADLLQVPITQVQLLSSEVSGSRGISGDLPRLALSVTSRAHDLIQVAPEEDVATRWKQIGRVVSAVAVMVHEASIIPGAFRGSSIGETEDIHQKLLEALRSMGDATTTAKVLSCCTQGKLFPFIMFMHQWLQRYWSPRWDNHEWSTFFDDLAAEQDQKYSDDRSSASVRVRHQFVSRNDSARSRAKLLSCAVPSLEVTWELVAVVTSTSSLTPTGEASDSQSNAAGIPPKNITIEWAINVIGVAEVFPNLPPAEVPWYVRTMRWCSAPLASARAREIGRYLNEHMTVLGGSSTALPETS
jgi:hypothetical protein